MRVSPHEGVYYFVGVFFVAGVVHVVVPGRLQLCHPQEDRCPEPQHWRPRLPGPTLRRQGQCQCQEVELLACQ